MRPIRFIFAIHNHQPIGNFDHLFEQSYQESYLPFLNVFCEYPALKLTLHTSGSLMEWLDKEHPEYVDRLAELVAEKRIEIIGGPFFEAILAMLPSRDRIGQIRKYTDWIRKRLAAEINGIWTPERVWEQSYVRDLSEAAIRYTILDDTHFKNAGVAHNELWKHYNTEDHGKTMFIFPGSETLRYLIPFRNVEDCHSYFVHQSEQHEGAVLIHADDGEKFGSWPNTFTTVFQERWLHRFFQMLCDNADWIITTTPSEVIHEIAPLGTVYLPDGSYREMTEWVLSAENQLELTRLSQEFGHNSNWANARNFIRGGFWRNFKVRYPESNEMYARMMDVSSQLETKFQTPHPAFEMEESLTRIPPAPPISQNSPYSSFSSSFETQSLLADAVSSLSLLEEAQDSLYRSQCNCGFWHGAFGGVYLPHLRNSVYRELIRAESIFDRMNHGPNPWVDAWVEDYNFDSLNEIKLASDQFALFVAPHLGGILYEMDVKPIAQNFLATMNRRPESYHHLVRRAAADSNAVDVTGNRVVLKQEGLDRMIRYDSYPRKSLVDLFYDVDADFNAVRFGNSHQHGSFVHGHYESVLRKKYGRIQLLMSCDGTAYGASIQIQKGITLTAGSRTLEVAYLLENLPKDYRMHFATELNFSGLPGGADDRYFETTLLCEEPTNSKIKTTEIRETKRFLGNLSTNLDLYNATNLSLIDDWAKVKVRLAFSRPTHIYAFPIETVNQSDGGFELVHQSVCVQPHWIFEPNDDETWSTDFTISFEYEE